MGTAVRRNRRRVPRHASWLGRYPGVAAALPGFHQIMRPVLLSPEQGADTIVWLATAPHARLGSGLFWHHRGVRPEYTLPWTRGKPLPLPANCGTTWTR